MQWMTSNWEDIRKYYADTYIKIPEKTGDKLWYVSEVGPSGVTLTNPLETSEEAYIHLWDESPYDIEMILPHKAMYQNGNYAYLMQRIPAQQYHRGICTRNCAVSILKAGGWEKQLLLVQLLVAFVDKPMYKGLQSIMTDGSIVSAAISDRWAVNRSGQVYVDQYPAGTINFEQRTYNINKIVLPEFENVLKANGEYGIYTAVK